MPSLRLCRWMPRAPWLSHRATIMLMAFLGAHVPLIALPISHALRSAATRPDVLRPVGVTLAATPAGTAVTLWVLDQLLRPAVAASRALRPVREGRLRPALPEGFAVEAGPLMADAQQAMVELGEEGEALRAIHADLARPVDANGVRSTPLVVLATAGAAETQAAALDHAVAAAGSATEDAPVVAHTPALRDRLRDRLLLEEELRAARRDDDFAPQVQPVMDRARGAHVGAEAPIRWNSPRRGFVPDRSHRAPGPARRLPRGRRLGAGPQGRRQPRRAPVHGRGPPPPRGRGGGGRGPGARPARDRAHRVGGRRGPRPHPPRLRPSAAP